MRNGSKSLVNARQSFIARFDVVRHGTSTSMPLTVTVTTTMLQVQIQT